MQVVNSHLLGIDWNAPMGSDEDADVVEIPATCNPLTPDFAQLQLLVDPLSDSDSHEIDQYLTAVTFTQNKVSQY